MSSYRDAAKIFVISAELQKNGTIMSVKLTTHTYLYKFLSLKYHHIQSHSVIFIIFNMTQQ